MHVSEYFKITKTSEDDWFDAILSTDTLLFLDPFLVFKEEKGFWGDAHETIIKHFELAFLLIAEGNLNPESLQYKKALALLAFKEPKEFCLGYTTKGIDGAGGGPGLAKSVAAAISLAIKRGLKNPKHFEEIGVLQRNIGPDRISDIALNILKVKLINYTQEIIKRHNIPIKKHNVWAASFDTTRKRWQSSAVELPTNPFNDRPFIFVPQRFLDNLPVLNADDWWEFYEQSQNLRDDINYEIMGKVDKDTIIKTARENPDIVREWTKAKEEQSAKPYDFEKDPAGLINWLKESIKFTKDNPLTILPPQTHEQFFEIIELVIRQFKLFIEEQGGWSLLWNEGDDNNEENEKHEHAPQLVFRGIASNYCKANNISLDAEVNLGRGPVDFKFSNGYIRRAHLEVKKVHNGKFWNGIKYQLPNYMNSDEVRDGWFVAIRYRNSKSTVKRINELPSIIKQISEEKQLNLRYSLIDGRPKISASKLSE